MLLHEKYPTDIYTKIVANQQSIPNLGRGRIKLLWCCSALFGLHLAKNLKDQVKEMKSAVGSSRYYVIGLHSPGDYNTKPGKGRCKDFQSGDCMTSNSKHGGTKPQWTKRYVTFNRTFDLRTAPHLLCHNDLSKNSY